MADIDQRSGADASDRVGTNTFGLLHTSSEASALGLTCAFVFQTRVPGSVEAPEDSW